MALPELEPDITAALAYLSDRSSHLNGVLKRTWPKDSKHINNIALAVYYLYQQEGEQEFDFERTPGVSFNPRSARIALILISDAKVRDGAIVTAGVLASARSANTLLDFQTLANTWFEASVIEAAITAYRLADIDRAAALVASDSVASTVLGANSTQAQLACSLFLDRARQLHRMNGQDRIELWEKCFSARKLFLALAEAHSPTLYTMLRAWERRFAERLLANDTQS